MMFKVILLTLFVGACFARPANQSPEEVQQDIDNFKTNLQVKYEETKNAGRDGFQQFLNYLQEQKGHLDTHYEQYKEQQSQAEQTRLKIQDLAKYLKELKEKAVDDAVGWTQEASDKANEMWGQISQYEKIPEERVVRTRRDVESHAKDAWDATKNAAKDAKDSAAEKLDHVSEDLKEGHRTRRDVASHAQDAWDSTKNAAKDAKDSAAEKIKHVGHDMKEGHRTKRNEDSASHAGQAWDKVKDAANKAVGGDTDRAGEQLSAAGDHAGESIKSKGSEEKAKAEDHE